MISQDYLKGNMNQILEMEESTLSLYSVLSVHNCLTRVGAGFYRNYCFWYHVYLVPEDVLLKDSTAFLFDQGLNTEANDDKHEV